METGDLVKLNITQDKVPGALTAVKYVMALEKQFGGDVGLVVEAPGDYIVVRFPTGLKMIEKKFLEIINESR